MINGEAGKGSAYRPSSISRPERDLRHILATNGKLKKKLREEIISAIDSKDINIMTEVLNKI